MSMPSVSISFSEVAATALKRGERGIIAMILKDSVAPVQPIVCTSNMDIPDDLKQENKEQIKLALMGYVNTPLKVIAYIIQEESGDYNEALNYLKTVKFDYLVIPTAETDGVVDDVVSYVKAEREENKLIKAILPNAAGDHEGIINYTTEKAFTDDSEYTTEQYCARIAGIIAGTPLSISCTYAQLRELTDCTRIARKQMNAAVDAGEFIVWWDGEKVKTARAVNSLVTFTPKKNKQFQKIKIVEAMDIIANDIRMTVEDNYLGKYANTYDNKCLLLSAIGDYFEKLREDKILSSYSIEIDTEANRHYLKGRGIDTDSMSEDEIKQANTGSSVLLKASLSILDAIEDIELPISI